MITKGLSVGAIFEDNGLYYEVQSVLPNGNYISKKVEKPNNATNIISIADEKVAQEAPARKSTRGKKKS